MQFDYRRKPGADARARSGEGDALISVVTPFYNAGHTFEETFRCVTGQTFPWFEWIIVNDGSTKAEHVQQLEAFAQREPRIRLLHQENAGPSAARNAGIAASRTDYILTIDADDLYEPVLFESLYWALATRPDASFSYCDSVGFGAKHYLWCKAFSVEREKKENILPITALVRKGDLLEAGCYHVADQYLYEDWQLWLELLARGKQPVHVQLFGFWYRTNDSGVFASLGKDGEKAAYAQKKVDEAASKVRADVPFTEFPLQVRPAAAPPDFAGHTLRREGKGKARVLLLMESFEDLPHNRQTLALAKQLVKQGSPLSVAALYPGRPTLQQAFFALTDAVYNLPGFLHPDDFGMFLSHHIEMFGVHPLLVDDLPGAGVLVATLRKLHPGLRAACLLRGTLSKALLPAAVYGCVLEAYAGWAGANKEALSKLLFSFFESSGEPMGASLPNAAFYKTLFENEYGERLRWFGQVAFCGQGPAEAFETLPGQRDFATEGDGTPPLFSVLTPCRHGAGELPRMLRAMQNQCFPWFEWLLVDDSGDDGYTAWMLSKLAESESRVRVVPCPEGGWANAMNAMTAAAQSDFLLPLDTDCLPGPGLLESLYWALRFHEKAAFCHTGYYEQGVAVDPDRQACKRETLREGTVLHYTAALRKEALLNAGGFSAQEGDGAGSTRLFLRMSGEKAEGAPVYLTKPLYWRWPRAQGSAMAEYTGSGGPALDGAELQALPEWKETLYPWASKLNTSVAPEKLPWQRVLPGTRAKPHVALLVPWMVFGGADLFNLHLMEGLQQKGYSVSLITTLDSGDEWEPKFARLTNQIYKLPTFLNPDHYPAYLSYLIASRGIDVLLVSNSAHGYYLLPWLKAAFPHLYAIDYVHSADKTWRNGGYARQSNAFSLVLDKSFACNRYTQRAMAEGRTEGKDRLETIYIGVDTEQYAPGAVPEGEGRRALGIETGRPVVLYPCRMAAEKRPFLMLEIARRMAESGSDAAFVAVGEGPELAQMQAFVREHGLEKTVYFAGYRADVRPFYRDAALTLICSVTEGLALTAYESMAMGTPVLTSDVGGQAELVTGDTGAVLPLLGSATDIENRDFPKEEIDAYVRTIAGLLGDEETLCLRGEKARQRVLHGFSSEHMVQRFDEELTALVQRPPLPAVHHPFVEELAVLAAEYKKTEDSNRMLTAVNHAADATLRSLTVRTAMRAADFMDRHPRLLRLAQGLLGRRGQD
ncbi:glycosyltransferase [Ruminococcaceae bacterium OttesenSCG-928-I18]|nr:glycosyltransferase [Ruminococcaceae bacterium OttesenSCG-928-I18]